MPEGQVPRIETERLVLRAIRPADLDEWALRIFADPDVVRYIPFSVTEPHTRAERMLAFSDDLWKTRGYGSWLVTDKSDGRLLGHCGLLYVAESGETEIDYALAQPAWGRGIASEAAFACLRFGFEEAHLPRVIGLAVPENVASRRVLERVGFIYQRDASYFGHLLAYHTLERHAFRPSAGIYRLNHRRP